MGSGFKGLLLRSLALWDRSEFSGSALEFCV